MTEVAPPQVPFLDIAAAVAELRPELDAAYARVVDSGWFVLGAELEAFEREFAASVGARHCVGVGTGLDAITLSLRALGIGPGDEVLVPGFTFIATWLAVDAVGATPVPVDVSIETALVDVDRIAVAITPRTRAIVPVHLYGQVAAMDAVAELARTHDLHVVEDAAQAHGATWLDQPPGRGSAAATWSFYPGKNLGALGDGGAVTTDDDVLATRLRALRSYGSTERYRHDVAGATNSRLDELQAAFLRARLACLPAWNGRRAALAARYLVALAGLEHVELPQVVAGGAPSWHLFAVRTPRRDDLAAHLEAAGIDTLVHYPVTPARSGAYADSAAAQADLPASDELAATTLSLPMGPHVTAAQADRVVQAVRSFRP